MERARRVLKDSRYEKDFRAPAAWKWDFIPDCDGLRGSRKNPPRSPGESGGKAHDGRRLENCARACQSSTGHNKRLGAGRLTVRRQTKERRSRAWTRKTRLDMPVRSPRAFMRLFRGLTWVLFHGTMKTRQIFKINSFVQFRKCEQKPIQRKKSCCQKCHFGGNQCKNSRVPWRQT